MYGILIYIYYMDGMGIYTRSDTGLFPCKKLIKQLLGIMAPKVPKGFKICEEGVVVKPSTEEVCILSENYWWKCQILRSPTEDKVTKEKGKKAKGAKSDYLVFVLSSEETWRVVPDKIAVKVAYAAKPLESSVTDASSSEKAKPGMNPEAPTFVPEKAVDVVPGSVPSSKAEEMKQMGPKDTEAVKKLEDQLIEAHNSEEPRPAVGKDAVHVTKQELDWLSVKIQDVGLHLNPSQQVIQGMKEAKPSDALSLTLVISMCRTSRIWSR